jgi:predicted negative regulator of RcsB-dependent stress response
MSEQYDEHEQSERVKQWLVKNGSNILTGILLVIAAIAGWQWWQNKQLNKGQEAANQYQIFINALQKNDVPKAVVLGESIITNYSKSDLAFFAALRLAKLQMAQSKPDLALQALEKAMTVANTESNKELVNLRIAQLYLSQNKLTEASKKLSSYKPSFFPAGYAEAQGDLAMANGKRNEAAAFYLTALNTLASTAGSRGLLELKLSNAGGMSDSTQSEIR